MKKILALAIVTTIFTLNVASAKQSHSKDSKTKVTTTNKSTVKKMKDTDDNLMSKGQNKPADYFNTKSC